MKMTHTLVNLTITSAIHYPNSVSATITVIDVSSVIVSSVIASASVYTL
jgi:hypothetical protein